MNTTDLNNQNPPSPARKFKGCTAQSVHSVVEELRKPFVSRIKVLTGGRSVPHAQLFHLSERLVFVLRPVLHTANHINDKREAQNECMAVR